MLIPAGTTPYRPDPLPQGDGSTCQWDHCVDASTAINIDRATVGRLRPTPTQVRKAADWGMCGGLSYSGAADATVKITGGKITPRVLFGIANGDVRAYVDGGWSVNASIDCDATVNTTRATNRFRGKHSVSVHDYAYRTNGECYCELNTESDHGEFLVEDPGTTAAGYRWWSSHLLYKAMQLRTGGHGCNIIAFRDTEGVTRTATSQGALRKSASTGSTKVATVPKGTHLKVIKTLNGGGWKRSNGTTAHGWMLAETPDGKRGYWMGKKVA